MSDSTLVLVDGMAFVYRAFYAIRNLSTSDGAPTNAVFGFIRMLNQVRESWKPTHLAVVMDGGLPESRTAILPEYKAQRPPMPDELKVQIAVVEEFLDCAEITHIRMDHQEADDVIASLAYKAKADGVSVLIATSDKDMFQIVGDLIQIVSVSGVKSIMDREAVKTKTGVYPESIVEWLALVGDSADNIPGVRGVGPKTAAKLLNEYFSLEGILTHLDDVGSDKLRMSLDNSRDILLRNVDMVRLNTALNCGYKWEDLKLRKRNVSQLIALFERLEFNAMAKELREPRLF